MSFSTVAFASDTEVENNSALYEEAPLTVREDADNFMDAVNQEMSSLNTSVVAELEEQIAKYTSMLVTANDEDKVKIEALINTTSSLIEEYESYSTNTRGSFHLIYSAEVAAAIAAFNALGYDLAAELLTHARDNDDLDSRYTPINGDDVLCSSVFDDIRDGDVDSGSDSFPNSGSTDEKDLYYALHSFYFRKSSSGSVVIIEDRYDYAQGSMGESFTGMVVNEMYKAQEAGVIVPYYSYIVQNTENSTANQAESVSIGSIANTRLFSEQVVLGKGEYKEFNITFDVSGYKTFQTFGDLDTKMTIYNANGTVLESDDDSGHRLNSFINYYCSSGVQYTVRVQFYSITKSGEFMFGVTPASAVIDSDSTTLESYEDIWTVTGYTGYTFLTSNVLNKTKMIVYTAPYDGEYTFELTSDVDTYIYVIDPRSNKVLVDDQDYNDDDGDGLNAKLVRTLEEGVPYLVIYCAYNPGNSSYVGDVTLNISMN